MPVQTSDVEPSDYIPITADAAAEELDEHAKLAAQTEHSLTFLQAISLYHGAVFWSIFFCLGQLMTGFDPQVMGNLFAMPAFQRDFGYRYQGQYIISAPWQTGLMMGNPIGQVVGSLGAGYPLEWLGRKRTFGACIIGTIACVFIQFFARSLRVLIVGELLGGLILGFYAVITPAYASEVCLVALRGVLTANINLFIVVGQFIANGICTGTQGLGSHWAYSAPYAAQWFWPGVILLGLPFAPESPWWLVRQGRVDEAAKSLRGLVSGKSDVEPTLAMIIQTDRLEHRMEAGSRYRDIFKKTNLRRTEICTGVYTVQVFSGIYLVSYGIYFFEQAGLATDKAFDMGLGFLAVGVLANCLSWAMLVRFGRRTIYNWGLLLLAALQLLIGVLDCVPSYSTQRSIIWAQASLVLLWNFFYNLTIGPVAFVLLCEVSATRVRGRTIAFATAVQAAVGIGMTVAVPYMINPDQANLRGKMGFFFGGSAAVCCVWSFFRVPETKGRTYQELSIMFERGVKTRDFKRYKIT